MCDTRSRVVPPMDSLRDRILAEAARLEAMPRDSLVGPRPVAARLRAMAEGRDC